MVTYCNDSHVDKGPVLQFFSAFPRPFQFNGNEEPKSKDDDGGDDVGRQGSPPDPDYLKRHQVVFMS